MKTIYKCEICGKEFPDWEECNKHEKTCKEIHATGLRLASELNDAVKAADERGGCEVGICVGADETVYRFIGAEYSAKERLVVLDIDTDNNLGRKIGGASNGND